MKIHFSRQESEVRRMTTELVVLRSLIDTQTQEKTKKGGFNLK